MQNYKLLEKHGRLLSELDLNVTPDHKILAKTLRTKMPAIHYAINSLKDRKALIQRARIDFFKLGLLDVVVSFSVTGGTRKGRKALENELVQHESTGWVGKLSGEYHYAALLLVRSLQEVSEFMCDLKSRNDPQINECVLSPRVSYSQYPRKYLSSLRKPSPGLYFHARSDIYTPDDLDHSILSYLGRNQFDSIRSLAQDLKIPASTAEYRLKSLQKAAVIKGIYYEVVPNSFGYQSFRFLLRTRALPDKSEKALDQFCAAHRDVVFLVKTFGSWDFEIGIEVADADRSLEFIGELYEFLGMNLLSCKTIQEVEDLKWSFYPFTKNPFI